MVFRGYQITRLRRPDLTTAATAGFHQLLVSKWDKTISMDIIQHWLNMINHEGWIPREQILGSEARSKVSMVTWLMT